jgi:hypothetical protein
MARYAGLVESAGRPLSGATVYIYTENPAVDAGGESASAFTAPTIYSDRAMATTTTNPLTTNSLGEYIFYIASGSQLAINVTRTNYGSKWIRNVDVTGSDPT